MAGVIYTEDRDTFEATFFKPPFLARMLERTAKYIDGLDAKVEFIALVHDIFWSLREEIKGADDVTRVWAKALEQTAFTRPRWLVHYGSALERQRWVKSIHLGRHR